MRISLIKKVSKLHHMNELYPLHFWQKISNTSFHYKPRIFFFFVTWISLTCLEIFHGIHDYFDMKNLKTFGGIHVTRKSKN